VACDSCPPADLAHLVEVAERGCLVAATLRQGLTVTASVATPATRADQPTGVTGAA
jgi:hypothetical protein